MRAAFAHPYSQPTLGEGVGGAEQLKCKREEHSCKQRHARTQRLVPVPPREVNSHQVLRAELLLAQQAAPALLAVGFNVLLHEALEGLCDV